MLRVILGALFVVAGVLHFLRPAMYVKIIPDWLPAHEALVYISGIGEILGGLGFIVRRTAVIAGWGLILLLIAVFPANINMAAKADQFPMIPPIVLMLRLPLQFVVIGLVWWCISKLRKEQ